MLHCYITFCLCIMMLLPKWITRCTYMKDDYIGAGLYDL